MTLVAVAVMLSVAGTAGAQFTDIAAASGVTFRHHSSATAEKYLPESMGSGVALLDFDRDGLLDIFFVNGAAIEAPMPAKAMPGKTGAQFWNRLYRNNGSAAGRLTFTDVTGQAGLRGSGYGMGVAAADYDNDGDTDLYVTNLERNNLYRNNGDGTFADVTARAGVAAGGWSTGAAFADYDRDGWLDLFVVRYLDWSFSRNPWCGDRKPGHRAYCHPDQFPPITHLVYRNNGTNSGDEVTFSNVSEKTGFSSAPGKGLGIAFHDFDRDGWLDVLIANDSFPQQLFRNRGNGTFEEQALILGAAYDDDGRTFAGMGVDFQDYDNDGWPDIFINALANQRYALFRNIQGAFEYHSGPSRLGAISAVHSGWGARFIDYDNDGWKDLFVAQGHVMDNIELTQPNLRYLEPMMLLRNRAGRLEDVSSRSGSIFQRPLAARGAAFGDLDNDGLVDIAVNCNNGPAVVLRNNTPSAGNWLLLDLAGGAGNRDAAGAKVRVITADRVERHYFAGPAGSYISSSDRRVHVGLAAHARAERIEITWPGGRIQTLENVAAGRILKIREPDAAPGAR